MVKDFFSLTEAQAVAAVAAAGEASVRRRGEDVLRLCRHRGPQI